MSYILDALKKAEAERNQGAVPGVHAQQTYADLPARPSVWRAPWPWMSLAAVAAIGATILMQSRPAPQPAVPALASAQPPVTAPVAVPPAAAPSLLPKEAPPRQEPAPPRTKKETAKGTPKTAEKAAPPDSAAKQKKPAPEAKPANSLSDTDTRIPTLRELPQDIQSQLPALSVNGYLYSDDKANRTVLINQRLLREGDQVAPDLKIEKLTPSGMVLNFRGHRYRTAY